MYFDSGTDVAGEVVEVGPQVKDFKAGDKVIALLTHQVLIFLFLLRVYLYYASRASNFIATALYTIYTSKDLAHSHGSGKIMVGKRSVELFPCVIRGRL